MEHTPTPKRLRVPVGQAAQQFPICLALSPLLATHPIHPLASSSRTHSHTTTLFPPCTYLHHDQILTPAVTHLPNLRRIYPPSESIDTVLNEHAWSFYLLEYPDRNLVDTLVHIICHGCNLGYKADHDHPQTCSNLKSAAEHPDAISADITVQVANGRTRGLFPSPPLPHFRSSPLGAALRKHSSKVCRIHHLS
jgi:hypothetical protein